MHSHVTRIRGAASSISMYYVILNYEFVSLVLDVIVYPGHMSFTEFSFNSVRVFVLYRDKVSCK